MYNNDLQHLKTVSFPNNIFDGQVPIVSFMLDNKILLQSYARNNSYSTDANNFTNPFYKNAFYYLSEDGNILKTNTISLMAKILPLLNDKQNSFYSIGGYIHIIKYSRIINDYLIKTDLHKFSNEKIIMQTPIIDALLEEAHISEYFPFDNTKCILITHCDILNTKLFNKMYVGKIYKKLHDRIGVYILDIDNKRFTHYDNLQNRINSYMNSKKKYSRNIKDYKNKVISICKFYSKLNNTLTFQLQNNISYINEKKQAITTRERYLCDYNIAKKKLNIILQPKSMNFSLIGKEGKYYYLWNYIDSNKSEILKVKFN